jgi:hypothetical protein
MGKEQRKSPRRAVSAPGIVFGTGGKLIVGCQLRDVSATGAHIILDKEAALPRRFVLTMSRAGSVRRACSLVWQFSIMAGARFALSPEQPPER